MRGLKPARTWDINAVDTVASFTDAWIETWWNNSDICQCGVASFTDAWIETEEDEKLQEEVQSHLLQMRGLKQDKS